MSETEQPDTAVARAITRRTFVSAAAAGIGVGLNAFHGSVRADPPIETMKIIVGFAVGGTADAVARRLAEKLTGKAAKTVIVENRTGAGGQIAIQGLKNAPADGSSILITPASMLVIYPHIYKKLAYDPFNDLTPLSTASTFDFGLAVGPVVPESVRNVAQFLAWSKANGANSNFGSPAPGSMPHFIGELLSRSAQAKLQHVPYRGSQPAIQDLIAGQIASVSAPVGEFLQHLPGGRVRLLATSGAARSRFAPSVPTYADQGYKDLQFNEWFGFFGPAKMPADVTARITVALREALATKEVSDGLAMFGMEAAASQPEQLAARTKQDYDRWGPIVRTIGFTADS